MFEIAKVKGKWKRVTDKHHCPDIAGRKFYHIEYKDKHGDYKLDIVRDDEIKKIWEFWK